MSADDEDRTLVKHNTTLNFIEATFGIINVKIYK